jgi:hypothetical protein
MKLVKQKLHKITEFYQKKPKLLIPTIAVVTLLSFSIFECARAYYFEKEAEAYKTSVEVQNLQQTVTLLNESTVVPSAAYCDLSFEGLLADFNDAYEPIIEESRRPENLHKKLQEQAAQISPPPSYRSLAEFLPRPKNASELSDNLQEAVESLAVLAKLDARSEYCLQLSQVLARTYFLSDIKKPEGVGALFVGQVENFQINVGQAQEMMKKLKYPTDFEAEHVKIFEILNSVAINLRKDENKYTAFARNIEQDVNQLEATLSSIRDKSADLQKRPQEITLQAGSLKVNQ